MTTLLYRNTFSPNLIIFQPLNSRIPKVGNKPRSILTLPHSGLRHLVKLPNFSERVAHLQNEGTDNIYLSGIVSKWDTLGGAPPSPWYDLSVPKWTGHSIKLILKIPKPYTFGIQPHSLLFFNNSFSVLKVKYNEKHQKYTKRY